MYKAVVAAMITMAASGCTYQPFGPPCSGFLPEGDTGLALGKTDAQEAERFKYYRCHAQRGDEEGQYRLGRAYEKGLGTDVNLVKARHWYGLAAQPRSGFEYRISVFEGTKGQYLPFPTGRKSPGHQGAKERLKTLESQHD